jgi:protein gp37
MWNPWHGCHKLSEGCRYCYVYRSDGRHGRDSSVITKNEQFDLPIQRKKRSGDYKIPSGNLVYTCFSSDFLLEDADEWRPEAWAMIRERSDLNFLFITKRIDRLADCLPMDWGDGYENVTICCTMENQDRVDYRLPIYKAAPIKHKIIICEPLLSRIDFGEELGDWVEQIVVGGESGREARVCDYDWVLDIRRQCLEHNISFWFKQTGARLLKDGRLYQIPRQFQHKQARQAGISF